MAVKKKRKPAGAFKGWEYVGFGDLHVSASTLARCVSTLQSLGETCIAKGIREIVCKGDFWEQRGVLSVRQVDAVLSVFQWYQENGITVHMIPGNHDQVTRDGSIHGMNIFEPFSNVIVYTEPHYDEMRKIAYIPWREENQEQAFLEVPDNGHGWTVFGHAEVEGALANNGRKAEGKVSIKILDRFRAVYLGHYHMRQMLGEATYYVGSPYEKDFGEMGWDHGFAIYTQASPQPNFFDLPDMPKHHRLRYPEDVKKFGEPLEADIVEVYASDKDMTTSLYTEHVEQIKAEDVRRLQKTERRFDKSAVPTFAVGLEESLSVYVKQEAKTDDVAAPSPVPATSVADLIQVGQYWLSQCPDEGLTLPWGKEVRFLDVTVQNFCRVAGSVTLPLDRMGVMLLRGGMGTGKTSMLDAMTWCLFGVTTPRKPGSSGASLKADAVINDHADEAVVTLRVQVDDYAPVTITRRKRRGDGAKIKIENAPASEGVRDQQDLIHHIVGINYKLWRNCVYLGQGAVGNFVTDANKARAELLSEPLGLGACTPVRKKIVLALKEKTAKRVPLEHELTDMRARLETIQNADYSSDMATWATRRTETIASHQRVLAAAAAKIKEQDEQLKQESTWVDLKAQHDARIGTLETRLSSMSTADNAGKLHSDIATAQAQLSSSNAELTRMRTEYSTLTSGGVPVCGECGQGLDANLAEAKLQDLEVLMKSKASNISTDAVRLSNAQHALGTALANVSPELEAIKTSLQESREASVKCGRGLNALAELKGARASLAKDWEQAKEAIAREEASKNPYEDRQTQREAQVAEFTDGIQKAAASIASLTVEIERMRFWEAGFGPKGVPVLVLRTAIHELENYANSFLLKLLKGRLSVRISMVREDLKIKFIEQSTVPSEQPRTRDYTELSGGMQRCVELAFVPFALGEMIFSRIGVRVPLLFIDELTTHLDQETKPFVCAMLCELDRESIVVIDHDLSVQGAFDVIYEVTQLANRTVSVKRAA